jgi:hypothetical protein
MRSSLRSTLTLLALFALAPTAQGQFTYTGTTVGGPTWNRPIDNFDDPPTDLSGTGTAVPYHVETFTVSTSGIYDLSSISTSDWDNYTFLYEGAFNAASPLTNVLLGNDDNVDIGVSGFLGVSLTTGQSYSLVTTGYENDDAGGFENAVLEASVFQSGTTEGASTWDPFGDGEAIPYLSIPFTVDVSGRYTLSSIADYDNLTAIYEDAFDPNSPDTNLVNVNDDNFSIGKSGFLAEELEAGRTYFFVTTGFDETEFGTFTNRYSGPGTLNAVPAPAALPVFGGGLSALALLLRKRRKAA